jgi:hypothetical protein
MASKIPLRKMSSDLIGSVVNGVPLQFRNRWNDRDQSWHVDIYAENGDEIVKGLKLLPHVNLTGRYIDTRLPPGGSFYAVDQGLNGGRPTFDSLGDTIQLWFILDSELV